MLNSCIPLKSLTLTVVLITTVIAGSSGKIYYVPDHYSTIQAAIDASSNGDTIIVRQGNYSKIWFKGKAVTVKSEKGAQYTSIISTVGEVVAFTSKELSTSVLDGFTIKGGDEGGIICNGSSPTIKNNTIIGNKSYTGGGIQCKYGSSPVIMGNHITSNEAKFGGAIYCGSNCSPKIINNTIDNNTANNHPNYAYGGAIYCDASSSPTIESNIIRFNDAVNGGGGGIFGSMANIYIRNNYIANNTASSGGGIFSGEENCYYEIVNNIIVKNNASKIGGGIGIWPGVSGYIINNTISENTAGSQGGGIKCDAYLPNMEIFITNTIVWGNSAPKDPQVDVNSSVNITYCNIQGGHSGTGNINSYPEFVGDYRISSASPCIEKGSNSAHKLPGSDIDGQARIIYKNVDIGADEYAEGGCTLNVPYSFATIQEAIDYSWPNDTVIVDQGTYYENVDFKGKSITVRSKDGPFATTIDGSRLGSVVTFTSGETSSAVLEGFHISNGYGNLGGAFTAGGVTCVDSDPMIRHNIFSNNYSSFAGGAMLCSGNSEAQILCNLFYENFSEYAGGAVFIDASSPTLINNTFSMNTANNHGYGGALGCWNCPLVTLTNSILWDDRGTNSSEISSYASTLDVSHCVVEGGWPGDGNMDLDPGFSDPSNDDFHLAKQSPCINRGLDTKSVSQDMDGDYIPRMGTEDIGADEYDGTHSLGADKFTMSAAEGDIVRLDLDAGSENKLCDYVILGSLSGFSPGIPLGDPSLVLPVNYDLFTDIVIQLMNTVMFQNFMGKLWVDGTNTAQFDTLGPFTTSMVGTTFTFAYAVKDAYWKYVSNPVNIYVHP